MVVIEKIGDAFKLHKTPFERNKTYKEPQLVKISGFYRLIQKDILKKTSLKPADSLTLILSNLWFSDYQKDKVKEYLNSIPRIIEDIHIYELATKKETTEKEILNILRNK
jgi:hypothetical protein